MDDDKQPNFLLIISDDLTYNDLPVYGGKNVITPNIDRLAREGLTFNQAYLAQAMCQPCRAELYSGLYPVANGCAYNHSRSKSNLTTMPHHLGDNGYRVGIAGKVCVEPESVFPFEKIDGFDRNCVRNPTLPHTTQGISEFMTRSLDQPFCLVVGLVDPHEPWVMGDVSQYPPGELELPPHIADTPTTRVAFAHYLAEITYMDGQVGDILEALEKSGVADNTVVVFTSEQGAEFPGGKWTNWNLGLHTGLIFRWPEVVQPGSRTDAMVQYADILPTFVDIAGGDEITYAYNGSSFLPVLQGKSTVHRSFTYGIHNNIPEGPAYPIRTVFDGTYRYIRNLKSDELYIEKHFMGRKGDNRALYHSYWASWLEGTYKNEHTYKLVKRYMKRPPEELYISTIDAFEHENQIDNPDLAEVRMRLSRELDKWMETQHDPGILMDTQEAYASIDMGV